MIYCEKFVNNKICVIGLGYVCLRLAVAFGDKFQVIRFNNSHYQNQ
jgi:UDP-N-acetyl-D-mannosaminuronate dehydrogenase